MSDKKIFCAKLENANIYQKKYLILHKVSLQIEAGTFSYLLGATGSGKTSLLRTLSGQLPLLEGEGSVGEFQLEKIDRLSLPFLRRCLGLVSPDFALLPDQSLEENLLYTLELTDWTDSKQCRDRTQQMLELLELQDVRHKKTVQLSRTNQVRGLIARALLNQPLLLLIDDPTSDLDAKAADAIHAFLHNFAKQTKTSVLFATSRSAICKRYPGQVFLCENGTVIAQQQ